MEKNATEETSRHTATESKQKWNWLKNFLPVPYIVVPILYLQGLAYYSGYLSVYKSSADLYPISFDQVLYQSFLFYVNLLVQGVLVYIWLAIAGLMFVLNFIAKEARQRFRPTSAVNRLFEWFKKFVHEGYTNHKGALVPAGVGFSVIYTVLYY
ncbi:MAG: hypothetical protein M1461_13035 [Nitrospirae bacterium]|nr:hypothetical protein [Nitrospirota bacterium]